MNTKFSESLRRLKVLFPDAYKFLTDIEGHSYDGFWLSTAANAHLYYHDSFLAYITFPTEGLEFSPEYHNRIESGTTDRHGVIFPEIFRRLAKNDIGQPKEWARFGTEKSVHSVLITSKAPPEFFGNLIEEIKRAHHGGNAAAQ